MKTIANGLVIKLLSWLGAKYVAIANGLVINFLNFKLMTLNADSISGSENSISFSEQFF